MEKNLWYQLNLLQKQDKAWHMTRIESSTINGIPDVHACVNGSSFWLELKSIEDKNFGLSKYQIIWQIDYINAGGLVYNLVFAPSQRLLKLMRILPSMFAFCSGKEDKVERFEVLDTVKYNSENLHKIIKSIPIRNS